MGYMRHHTIVVTGWQLEAVQAAHRYADTFFDGMVSNITPVGTNGYRSFFVPPDGSKEGWDESDRGNRRRADFIQVLRNLRGEDCYLDWIELSFADDYGDPQILDHNDLELPQDRSPSP